MSSATTTRMLVLGVVSIFQPANGYQIRRELLSWEVEQWADLKAGSVYSMLSTLTKQELLVRHDLQEGVRSVAVYAVSDAGRTEFRRLVSAGLGDSQTMDRTLFKTALSFSPFLPREDVLVGLRDRQRGVVAMRTSLLERIELEATMPSIPPQVVHSLVLDVGLIEAELRWLDDFVLMIDAGSLTFAGEPGGWMPPPADSGWEMAEQSTRYREQIAASSNLT
jgi:DNA-binding PadR family transcriptional regulator